MTIIKLINQLTEKLYYGAELQLVQFTGGYVDLDRSQQMQLGRNNTRLGPEAVLRQRALARASCVRIVIGPLRSSNFRRFLPGGDQLPIIAELVQSFTEAPIDHELELVLPAGRAPSFALGGLRRSRLGQDTWLLGACTRDTHILVKTHRATRS